MMLCVDCKKKKATVHITHIVNNHKEEKYLCEDCAKKMGEITSSLQGFQGEFSLPNLLAGFLNYGGVKPDLLYKSLTCDECGVNFNSGKFGCSKCYQNLGDYAIPILKRIHGASSHVGKIPNRTGGKLKIKKELKSLKSQMQKAIYEERFEDAAKLRDTIKQLESREKGV